MDGQPLYRILTLEQEDQEEEETRDRRLLVLYLDELSQAPRSTGWLDSILDDILQDLEALAQEGPYSIVAFPQGMTQSLSFLWMYHAYAKTSRLQRKNLKRMYMVKPTLWTKWLFRTWGYILSPKFFRKVEWVEDLGSCPSFIRKLAKTPSLLSLERKSSLKKNLCFGVELHLLMGGPEGKVLPKLVQDAVALITTQGLDVEGLFRVSPSFSEVQKIRIGYDAQLKDLDLTHNPDVHVACVLLKTFVRELPTPLFPLSVQSAIESLPDSQQGTERTKLIQSEILLHLSPPSYNLLKALMALLSKVHQNAPRTKMDANNLAIVWAPNFLRSSSPTDGEGLSPTSMSHSLSGLSSLIKTCIEDFDELF